MRRAELHPDERFARVGSLDLCYEDLGDPEGEPLILVMGLGTQLIHWNPAFVNELIDRGFRVIRFDNRDAGHSSKVDAPPPGTAATMFGLPRGRAYHLNDMADDIAGLADALEISSMHLFGVSMGGMMAQVTAYRHPERVRSLTMMMSGSGKRVTALRACARLARCSPTRRFAAVPVLGRPVRRASQRPKALFFWAACVVTTFVYPLNYQELLNQERYAVVAVNVRNAMLVGFLIWTLAPDLKLALSRVRALSRRHATVT